jgi:hypothetical protein
MMVAAVVAVVVVGGEEIGEVADRCRVNGDDPETLDPESDEIAAEGSGNGGNPGISDETLEDHRLGPHTAGAGGIEAVVVALGGCRTHSKNLTTGRSAEMEALFEGGELGKGRWMTALALGGGRGGMGGASAGSAVKLSLLLL